MRLLIAILVPTLLWAQQQLVWYPPVEGSYDWAVSQYENSEKQINVTLGARAFNGKVSQIHVLEGKDAKGNRIKLPYDISEAARSNLSKWRFDKSFTMPLKVIYKFTTGKPSRKLDKWPNIWLVEEKTVVVQTAPWQFVATVTKKPRLRPVE